MRNLSRPTLTAALAVGLLVTSAACGDDEDEEEPIPQTGNRPTTTTTESTTTTAMAPAGDGEDGMEGQDDAEDGQGAPQGLPGETNGDPAGGLGGEGALGRFVVNVTSSS